MSESSMLALLDWSLSIAKIGFIVMVIGFFVMLLFGAIASVVFVSLKGDIK